MTLIDNIAAAEILAYRTDADRIRLDCGHLATPRYTLVPGWEALADTPGQGVSGWPGYAVRADQSRICGDCATAEDVETMRTADRFTGYVSADGRSLTNWLGSPLGRIVSHRVSTAARKTYVQVVDVNGNRWHGQGPAESGTYVGLRRARTA